MTPSQSEPLSRREREIMDIVYALGDATAAEIQGDMAEPPSYSAVRGLLRVLVEKGHLRAHKDGVRNVYRPIKSRGAAGRSRMKRALETFYGGTCVTRLPLCWECPVPRSPVQSTIDCWP